MISQMPKKRLQTREIGHPGEDFSTILIRLFQRGNPVTRDVIPLVQIRGEVIQVNRVLINCGLATQLMND